MDNIFKEFSVKEQSCLQCKGNGYVIVSLEAETVPVDCKQCNNQGFVLVKCLSSDNGNIYEVQGPRIVSGGTN